ncbi:IPTL-CTERM sorting domain-containing protein [Wenzhouxiangella sp. XN79A]|uniref:IPTL-CTERM sorting domain-containing protein n=1 Tax=Wenzhouxiangella sp. XN79A TaxID=2724193 RepID=UPI00144A4D37|nr:IPTL-CTERM sorting domain-containing protein [Wenzhouxiangella sp. XN79A]NKI34199.1 IPTL-CTERM sorting domain-containing protein [Wenzhouxiangella sp. XN79A]
MNLKKNATLLAAAAALTFAAGASWAQDAGNPAVKGGNALLSSGAASINAGDVITSAPRGIAPGCFSFDGIDSWDGLDDADNIVVDLDIGAGNALTGVGWDIGIATVGASWLSEATIQHSDSTGSSDPNAINLRVGVGSDAPGDQDFTSAGAIVVFADNALPDIVAGPDGILRLQIFEGFDDNPDAVDANMRNAAMPALCPGLALQCSDQAACNAAVGGLPESQPVPVNSPWALALMMLVLAGLGIVAVRRFA